ncbi:hypothetical protein TrVE_jg12126 [Triparma verrucosa]|uniref:Uncharacterized protein n=1 Tax=Triparma verrucosa TaxID=1606542 RepID=A0A9W7C8B4_9STRA|nr:hypothetical protein TrVE_jg12126 [Triparma verrucosa]
MKDDDLRIENATESSPPPSHISITDASVTLTPDRNILYKIVSSTPSGVEQTSTTTVHAPTGELTGAIMGENTDEDTSFHVKGGGEVNKLYRDIVEDEGDDSKIVYWKIKLDEKTAFDFLLRLSIIQPPRPNQDSVVLSVKSVSERDLLMTLPGSSAISATRVKLDGIIHLSPAPLNQSTFTMTSSVAFMPSREQASTTQRRTTMVTTIIRDSFKRSRFTGTGNSSGSGPGTLPSLADDKPQSTKATTFSTFNNTSASSLLLKICQTFADLFKDEAGMDRLARTHFINDVIPNAPPVTSGEHALMTASINKISELSAARRVQGTANDPVQKFVYRDQTNNFSQAAWGLSVCAIDKSALDVFAELWLLDTYEYRRSFIREGNGKER